MSKTNPFPAYTEVPVSVGRILRFEMMRSSFVDPRNIDIWLPEGYHSKQKYAVLYMHDGQMLFDPSRTWNQQSWGVAETASVLMQTKQTRDFIVVGIWNNDQYRHSEYFPQKIIEQIPSPTKELLFQKQLRNKPQADLYLRFLVEELKPMIDAHFSTLTDHANTLIMGSSMGGLISLYGLCEYPHIFGGSAGLSTHLPLAAFELMNPKTDAEVAAQFRAYLQQHLPAANSRKIYLDHGDQTGDQFYKPYQDALDAVLLEFGYTEHAWMTRAFLGESHSESSWSKRLDIPMKFLLA